MVDADPTPFELQSSDLKPSKKGSQSSKNSSTKKRRKKCCSRKCRRRCIKNFGLFILWCVLMGGQAYWLYWLQVEIDVNQKEFDTLKPVIGNLRAKEASLKATNNKLYIEYEKLNETYTGIKKVIDGLDAIRLTAKPEIERLTKKTKVDKESYTKITAFYDKY